MSEFATDTAVRRIGDGRFAANLTDRWNIGANPNGGYLLATALRALNEASGRPDPLTLTAHYLSPPTVGPVEMPVEVVKAGRSFATVETRVLQRQDPGSGGGTERERIRVLGTFGSLVERAGPTNVAGSPPPLPPPEECESIVELNRAEGRELPEAMNRFEIRLPKTGPWGRFQPGSPLTIAGWVRFADGTEADTTSLVAFADALPPTIIGSIDAGWVPTLELTVHVRNRPAPGWIRAVFSTSFLIDGLMEEDGQLWDSEDKLVAQSRQLAMVLPKRS
jgi:acyl-CoA thioesterase